MTQTPSKSDRISLHSSVTAKKSVFGTTIDDDVVLFDPESGSYYGAGIVGNAIWALMSKPHEVREICEKLLEEFEIDAQTCEKEVVTFLNELDANGLIEVAETSDR